MGALVFKISGRRRRAGCGGFDSHAFPPNGAYGPTARAVLLFMPNETRPIMEIPLFQQDEPLRFERIILYPYPDLKRIWTRMWLSPVQDQRPNVEMTVFNPDGSENASVYMMARSEQRIETTLHLRSPQPGAAYRVVAVMTVGLSENPQEVDRQEFDLLLEFRDPDKREPGFGMGVNWEEYRQADEEN